MASQQMDKTPPELEVKLSRVDRVYCVNDPLVGKVVIHQPTSTQHSGIRLTVMGHVTRRFSNKAVDMFSMFDSIKPLQLLHQSVEIAPAGKLPSGMSEIPFSLPLLPDAFSDCAGNLYETYHGVQVSIQYGVSVDVARPYRAALSTGLIEFVLEHRKQRPLRLPTPLRFTMNKHCKAIVSNALDTLGDFEMEVTLDSTCCALTLPITGTVKLVKSQHKIASIDLQLVRKEAVVVGGDTASEISEVQSVQLADGDICRGMEIPIYMIPPRLFSCPTLAAPSFCVDFELNLVVAFDTVYQASDKGMLMAAYKFPITIYRG
mmetsp:Transcript_13410/g.22635  ORF Transcript_13410/g.22635 Transcript_13410/m.22635 type:complete len:318 (-) Transcript_13410:390-1343(-)